MIGIFKRIVSTPLLIIPMVAWQLSFADSFRGRETHRLWPSFPTSFDIQRIVSSFGDEQTNGLGFPVASEELLNAISTDDPIALEQIVGSSVPDYCTWTNGMETVLVWAVKTRKQASALWLIKHGANLSPRDELDASALDRAIGWEPTGWKRDVSVAKALLEAGADVNARNRWGESALHHAGSPESVELLIRYGANPEALDRLNRTPVHCMMEIGIVDRNLLEAFLKVGVQEDVFCIVARDDLSRLREVASSFDDFDREKQLRLPLSRKSLLHVAAEWDAEDCWTWLVDHGWSTTEMDVSGTTPEELHSSGDDNSQGLSFDSRTCSIGKFREDERPAASWVLRNRGSTEKKISFVQRTCGCLLLEYGEETKAGVRWRPVTGAADESFPPIPPGGSAQLRVSIAPFGRIGPFAKNVYVKMSDSEKPVVLTVTGDSRPLLEASPLSPLVVGTVPRGAPTDFRIEVTPSDPIVMAGTPYVTNAVCPASCTLDTNAIPWILSVTLSPQPDHRGPVGCDVRLPFVRPAGYREMNYAIQGSTVTREEIKRIRDSRKGRTDLRHLDVFRSPHCRICPGLERDLFDRLDLLPDWEVRYHDIDAPSEAALLMQIKHRLHGTRNEPVNVLLDGSTLLEGETAIREKLALP